MEHTQMRTSNHNQRNNNNRPYPELVVSPPVSEEEAAYYAALKLVNRIDEDLTKGIRHYRNKAGLLLMTLDQVINAILTDDLLLSEERKDADVVWVAPQELAA